MTSLAVDDRWFKNLIADRKMSQRQLARAVGSDPSSLTLLLQGKRRMTVEKAAAIARELNVTIEDVLSHAGVSTVPQSANRVPIIGYATGTGAFVAERIGNAAAPMPIPDGAAVVFRTAGSPLEFMAGWLAFLEPPTRPDDAMLDRTGLVTTPTGQAIRLLRRGSSKGKYTLTGWGEPPAYDVTVTEVQPVLILRPI